MKLALALATLLMTAPALANTEGGRSESIFGGGPSLSKGGFTIANDCASVLNSDGLMPISPQIEYLMFDHFGAGLAGQVSRLSVGPSVSFHFKGWGPLTMVANTNLLWAYHSDGAVAAEKSGPNPAWESSFSAALAYNLGRSFGLGPKLRWTVADIGKPQMQTSPSADVTMFIYF